MSLSIRVSQQDKPGGLQATVVRMEGRLDTTTSPQAEKELAPIIQTPPKVVELDLAGLNFVSSAGLRVLLGTRKSLGAKNSQCFMTNLQPQIQKVFDIVKALPGMSVFKNTQELDDYLGAMQRKMTEGQ